MKEKIIKHFEENGVCNVHWTKLRHKGRSIQLTQAWGKLIAIRGDFGIVRQGKKESAILLNELRLEDQKSHLTDFLENLAKGIE